MMTLDLELALPAHDVLGDGAVRPRARLGRVRERQARGVDDAVRAHQRDRNLKV